MRCKNEEVVHPSAGRAEAHKNASFQIPITHINTFLKIIPMVAEQTSGFILYRKNTSLAPGYLKVFYFNFLKMFVNSVFVGAGAPKSLKTLSFHKFFKGA